MNENVNVYILRYRKHYSTGSTMAARRRVKGETLREAIDNLTIAIRDREFGIDRIVILSAFRKNPDGSVTALNPDLAVDKWADPSTAPADPDDPFDLTDAEAGV